MAIDQAFNFDNSIVASTLKRARQKRGLTLDELSMLTKEIDPLEEGVSRVALSRYENGASLPGLRELRLLSFALRYPLSYLVYDEHMDPMLNYKTSLEMRLTDMAFDTVLADGVIKDTWENEPDKDEAYLKLLQSVKGEKKRSK